MQHTNFLKIDRLLILCCLVWASCLQSESTSAIVKAENPGSKAKNVFEDHSDKTKNPVKETKAEASSDNAAQNSIEKWTLTKAAKVGGWDSEKEQVYSQLETQERFVDYFIGIEGENINVNNLCLGKNELIKEGLELNLNGDKQQKKETLIFLQENFSLNSGNFKGIIELEDCEYPFHKILVFDNAFLVREYGAYYFLFSQEGKIKTTNPILENVHKNLEYYVNAKECSLTKKEDLATGFESLYGFKQSQSLTDLYEVAYLSFNENMADMLAQPPKENKTYKGTEAHTINYQVSSETINIEFNFDGGVTLLEISENPPQIKLIESPD